MLDKPVRRAEEGGGSPRVPGLQSLLELRKTVEGLDPSQLTGIRKLLGNIPFGDKVVDYFRRYESAQSQLNAILNCLRNGQDELERTTSR